jgi:poly(3-hydroxybutyrate) depolymerase
MALSACTADAIGPSDAGAAHDSGAIESTTGQTTPDTTPIPDEPSTTATTTTTLLPLDPPTFESVARVNTIREFTGYTSRGLARWQQSVPGVEDIRITSTADGAEQPALWVAPSGDRDQPLLVILHSWSAPYLQHAGIPYAMWAQENGWAVIAPEFRGVNDDADALGSELAVQDVVDAIDYAVSQDGVDANRVFAVGYSGGGMMSLLLAGRHPDKVTAVAAWGPTYDLVEFYRQSRAAGRHYAGDLSRACGGDPRESGPAQEECLRRSPMTYLDAAREHGVPVFIGQGIYDSFVSPSQGATAFNQLADPEDRLSAEELDQIGRHRLPEHLLGSITTETFFREGDPEPVFARQSGAVWLVFFRADHEMVYQATLRWFASDPR